MLTTAGFNRRMRKTACPVVWKGCGVQLPSAPSNQTRPPSQLHRDLQPQHERVVRLAEPAGPNNVLDVRLDGKSPLRLKIC